MSPALRKLMLVAHVSSSVGWFGALAAFLALSLAGLANQAPEVIRASDIAMDMITRFVIVPLSITALLTGVFQSLGTEWGLLRHYWVLAKLGLTVLAVAVLLLKTTTISYLAELSAMGAESPDDQWLRYSLALHAAGGLAVLLFAGVLGIYKPRGMTRRGARGLPGSTPAAAGTPRAR